MGNPRFTSRVFVAGRAILDALTTQASIPPHPITGLAVPIGFGDEHPDAGAERIGIVIGQPDNPTGANEWARLGPAGRDETMRFLIVFRSMVPNMVDTLAVWSRLEEVTGACEDVLFDRVARTPIELGYEGEVPVHRSSGVMPIVFPSPQGPMGSSVITVELLATI